MYGSSCEKCGREIPCGCSYSRSGARLYTLKESIEKVKKWKNPDLGLIAHLESTLESITFERNEFINKIKNEMDEWGEE